jgi:hypothetical protein
MGMSKARLERGCPFFAMGMTIFTTYADVKERKKRTGKHTQAGKEAMRAGEPWDSDSDDRGVGFLLVLV